jgi:DNA-binding Lrp family transcriptional regulator
MASGTAAVRAYILVQADAYQAWSLRQAFRAVDGVVHVASVVGPYDFIVTAEAADLGELGWLIAGKIRSLNGVTRAVTCLVASR